MVWLKRTGLSSSHEEADHILVQQYQGEKVRVISDDTYVLVLLPNVYAYHTTRVHVLCTWAPSGKSSIVDLEATAQKNKDTTKATLVMLALTWADSVTATCNVGQQVARMSMEQRTQTICPSLVTLKPILIKYAAPQCGHEKSACILHCVASSIVQCVAPVKLVHRVSNH